MTSRTWTFSTLEERKAVEHEILDAVRMRALEADGDFAQVERHMFGIRMALEEALVNHIKHGNQLDPAKVVTCTVDMEKVSEGLSVTFDSKDMGVGFSPDEVPDPTLDENMERPGGRGVLLIRHYATVIEYSEGGTRLRMSFLLKSAPEEGKESAA